MAEMLRALVQGRLEAAYLKGLVERLRGLGLGEEDCRDVILMLSFLLQIRDGDYSECYRALVAEVMTMLQLEDSWVYQAGTWKGEERGEKKGLGTAILTVLNARGLPVSEPLRQRILSCEDTERLTRWLARAATASSAEDVVAET